MGLAFKLGVTRTYLAITETRQPDDLFDVLTSFEIPADELRVSASERPPEGATARSERATTVLSKIRRDHHGALRSWSKDFSAEFGALVLRAAAEAGPASTIAPYADSLRAGKNSRAYRAHSYHTKVPPEVIEKLIRHHTTEGQLVIDPFCGSGMTGVAAIGAGRNSVLSDLSPAAVHIAQNYTTPCASAILLAAVARLEERVRPIVSWLYETDRRSRIEYTVWSDIFQCPHCASEIVYWDGARDPQTGGVTDTVRCSTCRHATNKRDLLWIGEKPVQTNAKGLAARDVHQPTSAELELIERANSREILHWVPQVPFNSSREMWRAGHAAAGISSVADFYTKRNLHALAAIRHEISEERDDRVRSALLFAFTGMVNRASKRYQWNQKRPTNVMTGTLYVSSLRYEWNVWSLFERKARDAARYFEQLGRPAGRAAVIQASATALDHLPDQCADYVFMDPPFGANIFYADSGLLWDSWLGSLTDERHEIVVNKHRTPGEGGKTLADYQRLMTEAFREVARVLKRNAYATLQFNNSSGEVWCAIQDALRDAGLEIQHAIGLDKIHPSIKGVKGRQAKENVAALDALIELRRPSVAPMMNGARTMQINEMRQALLKFGITQASPFTVDDAFSALVRGSLMNGASLAGVSLRTVKCLCAEIFEPVGTRWKSRD